MAGMGYEDYLYINTGTTESPTWTELSLNTGFNVKEDKPQVEATPASLAHDGYEGAEEGLKKLEIEFDCLEPGPSESADTALEKLKTVYDAGGTVEALVVENGAISTDGLTATKYTCGVFGGNQSKQQKETKKRSYVLAIRDTAPVNGTTSSSAFSPSS